MKKRFIANTKCGLAYIVIENCGNFQEAGLYIFNIAGETTHQEKDTFTRDTLTHQIITTLIEHVESGKDETPLLVDVPRPDASKLGGDGIMLDDEPYR